MDLKIGSINVGGLGDQVKKCTVQKTIRMIGVPNGAIKLYSAVAPVKRQVLPYFLTITSTFKFLKRIPIPRDVL